MAVDSEGRMLMIAWQEHDFEAERRRVRLSQSQPLKIDWVTVAAWVSGGLVCTAVWRVVYLAAMRLFR